jgi:uncharacterized membrane protein
MPTGTLFLLVVIVLVYFGIAQRVLDRMRLTDRGAMLWIVALIVGSFIDIPLTAPPVRLVVNVGGGIVPLVIAGYLIGTADRSVERVRAILGALVTGAVVFALGRLMPAEPGAQAIDPVFTYGITAGLIGYLSGRSRRASFVAGTGGVIVAQLGFYAEIVARGIQSRAFIGGGGAFDSVVIAGLLAVLLAEFVGEARERVARVNAPPGERGDEKHSFDERGGQQGGPPGAGGARGGGGADGAGGGGGDAGGGKAGPDGGGERRG